MRPDMLQGNAVGASDVGFVREQRHRHAFDSRPVRHRQIIHAHERCIAGCHVVPLTCINAALPLLKSVREWRSCTQARKYFLFEKKKQETLTHCDRQTVQEGE